MGDKKYVGLRAYIYDDKNKKEGIIGHENNRYILKYPDGTSELIDLGYIILLDDICRYGDCRNTDIFDDGLCEVCHYKFEDMGGRRRI